MSVADRSPQPEKDATMGEHYAYCTKADCHGCLPSDEELALWATLPLWGECVARCIEIPRPKGRDSALAALIADGPSYRAAAAQIRERVLASE